MQKCPLLAARSLCSLLWKQGRLLSDQFKPFCLGQSARVHQTAETNQATGLPEADEASQHFQAVKAGSCFQKTQKTAASYLQPVAGAPDKESWEWRLSFDGDTGLLLEKLKIDR